VLTQSGDTSLSGTVVATFAELARQSPAMINDELQADILPSLLAGCNSKFSRHLRRFSVTTLGYLRRLGPEVGAALLDCCRDVHEVRTPPIEAAQRFQQFSPAVLDDLLPELTGPSASTAYAVSLLLQALGTSRQAVEQPAIRVRIADALAAACTHPDA